MVMDEEQVSGATTDVFTHSIGEAARLAGVSRSLLRLWEREGLISPARTPGGHRVYSAQDIQRLRHIARLRWVDGLNAAAIRRELDIEAPPDSRDGSLDTGDIGQRLRALRTASGKPLADVSRHSGLSISFLSALERGQSNISVGNLFKLADAYGTTVPALGSNATAPPRAVLHREERSRYTAGGGKVRIEDLIATPGALEAQFMEILPGGGSEEPYAHPGEEMIYILSGTLTFVIDERERYDLVAEDSLYFQSTQLHRWWNEGPEPVTLIWINVPLVNQSGADRRRPASRRPSVSRARRGVQ